MSAKSASKKSSAHKSVQSLSAKRVVLDRAAWIVEAREALIKGGIASVKIGKLATRLEVTRESFYWHFKNLQELHDELLRDWEATTTSAHAALLDPQHDGAKEFLSMVHFHLDKQRFNPAWNSAVRDWARVVRPVELAVRRVDEQLVEMIKQMFLDMGYDEVESLIRARITHFHQIGYYNVNPGESEQERMRLLPVYVRLLTGLPLLE